LSAACRPLGSIGAVLAGGPDWCALVVTAQAIPCAWTGGALRQMQLRSTALGGAA
jgi:hypothetical protein